MWWSFTNCYTLFTLLILRVYVLKWQVAKPRIGENHPARVSADVTVNLNLKPEIKREWESEYYIYILIFFVVRLHINVCCRCIFCFVLPLTSSMPAVTNYYCLKHSVPYWSNPPVLIRVLCIWSEFVHLVMLVDLRKHDVAFLLTVRPVNRIGTRYNPNEPFVPQVGLIYVRGCEIEGMLDEAGKVIEEGLFSVWINPLKGRGVNWLHFAIRV